ncbi:hypothetical protein KKE06_05565 [Candidatus Micrarchaeota archaeon]|nr:hypothetical protein [Candidatus Micrarchaeota archaeon]MBU1930595.1 hypothetical protein [Candidatus Micrarchaeota archaeon]
MKFHYCSKCAGVDLKRLSNGNQECLRCHFTGEAREGAMNEINAFKKQLDLEKSHEPKEQSFSKQSEDPKKDSEWQKKLGSLKGKRTEDFEIW